ncbi:hypothetical protein DMC30DRAFT_415272 [Rhodotorula diobovata]|uniref:DUF6534 domain-containing protein n=1 Tax=Rhodotorula diobovata TaxID=5288 RepID=A0A5C5FZH0_9BASI|nr:hypothetical protein DMC30DRAFT_415272 [Rhodotorula diobovata]
MADPAMDPQAAAEAAAQAALFQWAVREITTPVVVASFIACLLYGVLLYMAATYFLRFGSTDRLAFKVLVGFLTLSALGDTINDCAWAWLYTVKAFTDPNVLALFPPNLIVYACITGPNVLLTQGFFTWRVWVVSGRKNWIVPSIMTVLVLLACAMAFTLAAWVNAHTYMTEFGDAKWLIYTWLASGFVVDVIITAAITYYLIVRPQKLAGAATRAKLSRENPLGRIVIKTFQTNSLSLLIHAVTLVVMIVKGQALWYSMTGFQMSKLYIISLIATLNARHDSASGESADFSSRDGTTRGHTSLKGRSTFNHLGQSSVPVHVHISEEVKVDDGDESASASDFVLSSGPATPYSVRFERVHGHEKSDELEMGRKEEQPF